MYLRRVTVTGFKSFATRPSISRDEEPKSLPERASIGGVQQPNRDWNAEQSAD